MNYYGSIMSLIKSIEKRFDINISNINNTFFIKRKEKELKINYLKNENSLRSFSIPFGKLDAYVLNYTTNNYEYFSEIIDFIREKCLEYSDLEINTIIDDMTVCKWYSNKYMGVLKDVAIIWRDHFLEENIGLLNGFVKMGVKPSDILALDKGDSTLHRNEIKNTFIKMGFNVNILDNASVNDKDLIKIGYDIISDFILSRKNKKIIILDDGAIITKILNKHKFENIISVIELTEMGLRRINKLDKIDYPVLNVAKTKLKRNLTYPEISNSIFVRIIELLGGEKLVGKAVLLCGYGDMGEILADRLKNYGCRVSIVDPDIMRLIMAGERGFNTYRTIIDAVKDFKPFLIIGASGYNSITKDIFKFLGEKTFFTGGATADLALFNEYQENSEYINKFGTQYLIDDKKMIVLGNGRSVNLYYSEAIPNRSNDIFKAGTLVTVLNSYIYNNNLNNDVNLNIVDEWINNSGILDYYYDLHIKK